MKKYKQFIIGLLIGTILFSSIGVCAEEVLNVIANPYPVFVNGQEIQVEAYNINGFTFLKLADVGKVLDSTVSFNETEKRIEITSNKKDSSTPSTLPDESTSEGSIKYVLEGNLSYFIYRGTAKYVEPSNALRDIRMSHRDIKLPDIQYLINEESKTLLFGIRKNNKNSNNMTLEERKQYYDDPENYDVLIEHIPIIHISGSLYVISYDNYINDIKPRLLKALGID